MEMPDVVFTHDYKTVFNSIASYTTLHKGRKSHFPCCIKSIAIPAESKTIQPKYPPIASSPQVHRVHVLDKYGGKHSASSHVRLKRQVCGVYSSNTSNLPRILYV